MVPPLMGVAMRTRGMAVATIALLAVAACDQTPATPGGIPPAALEAVKRDLLDPFSAEVRDVRNVRGSWCGQVNAKNRFGAYVGWKTFYAFEADGVWQASIASDTRGQLDRIARIMCGESPDF